MDDDYRKRYAVTTQVFQASKKKHERHQTNWEKVNKLSLFYAAKASAAFLCQQNRWSVCHGIGCNISPKHPMNPSFRSGIFGDPPLNTHRGYNSFNNTLVFRDETLDLDEILTALESIHGNCRLYDF
ncbi:hypothetical protein [Mucilaginibacter sp. AK015]|uniref:hypothetical protein n=1 Tax=Mucilaginibacter sp. AK015 TaxID=2723072 RepID=UPI0016187B21|nr:hypothetical protein [Mucilaginibacter sp. AK015]MBB5396129.1 hypothetical protein [Mucilaginibacter sp. AK015]